MTTVHVPTGRLTPGMSGARSDKLLKPRASKSRASRESLEAQALQSEAIGDDVGGRKWNQLQTVIFAVAVSGSMWVAIGYTIFRLLRR